MKKIVVLTLLTLISLGSYAQDGASIVAKYRAATKLEKALGGSRSHMINATIKAQGQEIPTIITISTPGPKMRAEMTMMGQKVTLVINGDKGWMVMPGMGKQVLPAEQVGKTFSQNDILESVNIDPAKMDLKFIGTEKVGEVEYQVVEANEKAKPEEKIKLYFDPATSLLAITKSKVQGMDVTMHTLDYKNFGELLLPGVINVEAGGNIISTVTINDLDLEYPIAEWMFAEPEK